MTRLLLLALLLASPLSARAQRLSVVPAEPVTVAPNVIGTFPLDGFFAYRPDDQCSRYASGYTMPDTLDLYLESNGPLVAAATDYARAACPAN